MDENTQLAAFADESSVPRGPDRQEYLICAAIIDTGELDSIREILRPLLLPGQRKLHWTDESDRRRREIVAMLTEIDAMQVIVTHRSARSRKTERYRRKCLEQLYFELEQMKVQELTLESRLASQDRKDHEHLAAVNGRGHTLAVRINHVRGGNDPLLWIPDILLGALNAAHLGITAYWESLRGQVVLEKSTPDSTD